VFGSGEVPVLQIDLLRDGQPQRTVYVMPAWAAEELLERLTTSKGHERI
jgi:hypothetical protein